MRRAACSALGFARQAAAGALDILAGGACAAPICSSRAAWLQPGGAAAAAAATASGCPAPAALAAAHCLGPTRGFNATCRPQHNAQPEIEEPGEAQGQQGQQQRQRRRRRQHEHERTCWQCGTPQAEEDHFFCRECQSVQPASADPQYFEVFSIDEPRFNVDLAELEREYKGLQRRLHPDKFTTASPLEQEYAHQQAAVVNQAYDVLKKPLRRAHYILNQAGFGACEGMTITDPELLMYVMEAREEVESTDDKEWLQKLLEQNTALKRKCIQELGVAFGAGDLQHAAELTTQLRYICRIREAIMEKL